MTADIAPFYAIEISRLAHALKDQGRSIIHMEFGQPSTGAPKAALDVAHTVLDTEGMGYWESTPLKQRLAKHYLDSYGVSVDPDRFIITCGASPALVLALSAGFKPGARIALARPGYVAYRNVLRALNMVPLEIPCGPEVRFQLTARALAALDPAPDGVIIASPANPTGTLIAPDELKAIAEVCRDRGIRIVSDEIYHGLTYEALARSLLEHAPDAWVVSSFSKYFSMVGWRLGWCLAPESHLPAARAYVGNLFLTAPSLSQHAGLIALDSRDELDGHVETYRRNRRLLLDALPELGLSHIAPPDGAFYVYADIGHLTDDSLQFCKDLLSDTGVATAPGIDFDPVEGHRFIRFSFAVSTPEVEEALKRLVPWFKSKG
ncbi:aminotransferase class I/II-fold pyridoxal phosphate-dependent enzyme [Asticcacaulis sp. AND118]|uniref:aminotransferase class I/II-fold pyridoxal phosphate-dependent enzyme n=1 Tax=Asticcacaulis sp. AND118 TaxID=2840468 RepID=UPI001D0003FD|nr:aminotransferase class I/II-fold pyridoxal phosphate-dependent enzyme [Asticcacaulis sp. AND118]UDF02528.1 aminotransferase class I/II-fold pyridoxal phosphate-dependent enzyme [Asticcacaulis sp. AND118]